ncbi:MAG: putative O-glycosylation ligase, exosortase A system-associated [Pseudorhodoferax sp.]
MRDLMMLGMMAVIVPLALSNAFAAYLVWGWTSVITVPFYLYGFMGSLRYNFFFALVTLGLIFIGKIKEKGEFTLNRTTMLILLFVAHGTVSAVLAKPSAQHNWSIYIDLIKSLTYCMVMFLFVTSRFRLHAMLVAIALGLGFHGLVEGMKTFVTAGGHRVIGLPGSKMADNNHFGVAIVMVLPILLYLYQYSKYRLVRFGFLAVLASTAMAVVGSNSRGALLAMCAFGAVLVVTSRRKVLAMALVLAGAALVVSVGSERWLERMETIGNASEDQSFMGRVDAWNISTALALRNPVFGTGFHAMQSYDVWHSVRPRDGLLSAVAPPVQQESARAAHSIYFEVLGDLGFVGLLLFLAIMANAFLTAREVKRMAARAGPGMLWARDMADTLALSCFVFAVGGAGVSLAYFETFYVIVILIEVLRQCVQKQMAQSMAGAKQGAVGTAAAALRAPGP